MADLISVRLGKDLERELSQVEKKWRVDRSEIIRRLLAGALKEWKLNNALEELAAHKITLGRAAELAEVSLWEMMDIVKKKKIDWVGYTEEDVEKDLEIALNFSKKIK